MEGYGGWQIQRLWSDFIDHPYIISNSYLQIYSFVTIV